MPQTIVLVGTRKGCFILESDADRRDWKLRGPYCEGWPDLPRDARRRSPARSTPRRRASGTAPASGAAPTSARRGSSRARASRYDEDDGLKLSKVSALTRRARAAARRRRGGRASSRAATAARRGRSSARSTGQPGREHWNDPANQPPGHLGLLGDPPAPRRARRASGRSCRASASSRRPTTARSWTPRNKGLRADWPLEDPEVGYCVHKLVMSPADRDRMYQQNHVGMHRSDDGGQSWTEITEGLPTEFGFAAAAHPHDRDTFYVDPARPGPRPHACPTATPRSGARATRARAGSGSTRACRSSDAHLGVLREGMAIDALRLARPLLRHEHGPGVRERRRGRELERDRELPAGDLVGRGRGASHSHGRAAPPHHAAAALPRAAAAARRRRGDRRRGDRPARRAVARACATGCASRARRCGRTSTCTSTASAPGSTRALDERSRVDVIAAISGG